MKADLHCHSTASDGSCTPTELLALAARAGLTHLAITDHDSVEGLAEAACAAERFGITLIPGVELSAVATEGSDVHLLGYFIDPGDAGLRERLADMRDARMRRAAAMVDSLAAGGLRVSLEEVLQLSNGGSVGRSHVARALVDRGHAHSVRDAFERFIGRGRPFYVPKDVRSPEDALDVIRDAGGVGVVAHPGVNDLDALVTELALSGRLDGVEAYHADHTPAQRLRFEALARDCGLLVTGGSDFHAPEAPNAPLGSVPIPDAALVSFLAAGRA